ncbi:hypothetical protein Csa_016490 [Cucumis sativus]|uniref:Uncharacterized protein n=1 Tax=Cucumis sativus TaxID=3659 RepID=A0A0A0K4M2_CUCSA|nr:hypothetical protein Csa_016490 [Cucumis sativus]
MHRGNPSSWFPYKFSPFLFSICLQTSTVPNPLLSEPQTFHRVGVKAPSLYCPHAYKAAVAFRSRRTGTSSVASVFSPASLLSGSGCLSDPSHFAATIRSASVLQSRRVFFPSFQPHVTPF